MEVRPLAWEDHPAEAVSPDALWRRLRHATRPFAES